jgi:4-amino-4-deoxy-L-arabinose transferase-like glycosyltransferase
MAMLAEPEADTKADSGEQTRRATSSLTEVRPSEISVGEFSRQRTSSLTIAPSEKARPKPEPRRSIRWWLRPGRPAWSIPARAGVFGLAGLLYSWNLSRNGIGNVYYAAAVKSGVESWKAFFFGSLDPGSFITIDKPPAALWVMELSARIFGFSSWSILLPQALAGLTTVMVLYHLVRRWFGEPAAVLASLGLALTPVVVVIFRFNDPDAFITLLLVLATCACWHAIESGKTRGLVLSGLLLGLAFLTKSLDAFLVVPALGLSYLCFGPPRLARRIGQLGWGAMALVVSSGWWVAVVELWPKGARPYIGGSTNNSVVNLIFGYNGISRITGSGPVIFADGGQGLFRMFDFELGGQISWFLLLAIVGVVGGFCLTRGRARTDRDRAGFVLWGGMFLTYFAVFDDARGLFHPYYTVVMAPAVAALAGAGSLALWQLGRRSLRWAWVLPMTIVLSVLWSDELLVRSPSYGTWLGLTAGIAGVAAAFALFMTLTRPLWPSWCGVAAGTMAAAAILAGPLAYSLTSVNNVTTSPATAGPVGATRSSSARSDDTVSQRLVNYLEQHRGSATYLVAVTGSTTAAPFVLQSGQPVIAMGGYLGWDPTPTLGVFRHLVATGMVRYVYATKGFGATNFGETNVESVAIDHWVTRHAHVVPPSVYGGTSGTWTLYVL